MSKTKLNFTTEDFDAAFSSLQSELLANPEHDDDDCARCAIATLLSKSEGIKLMCLNLTNRLLTEDFNTLSEMVDVIFNSISVAVFLTYQTLEAKKLTELMK